MGPGFIVLFWAIILTPIGLLIGVALTFIGVPVYYRARGVVKEQRKIGFKAKASFTIIFTAIFVPIVCTLGIYLMVKDLDDYWKSQGAWDSWRMPLEKPYELVMIDIMDNASISEWKKSPAIVGDIKRYEKRNYLIVGETLDDWPAETKEQGWFIFDCKTGIAENFKSKDKLFEECVSRGFDPPLNMKTIRVNWDLYWSNPAK